MKFTYLSIVLGFVKLFLIFFFTNVRGETLDLLRTYDVMARIIRSGVAIVAGTEAENAEEWSYPLSNHIGFRIRAGGKYKVIMIRRTSIKQWER